MRGTSGRSVNIDIRFLRIVLRIDALIRKLFQGVHATPFFRLDYMERTTKKGRRRGSKGKNDENWRYCVQNCLHSGKSPNELIQCHLCQSWIHPECVGEDGKDIVGIWTCTSCRQMPVLVSRLLEKTSALESLIEKLTVSNQQLVALVVEQQQDLRKLNEKISNPITDTIDAKWKRYW